MPKLEELLKKFETIAANPRAQLDHYLAQGKKVIGCFPYYVPEELVRAAGMVPFGIWGATGTISAAKKYFPPFYCTIAQMGLELALTGKLKGLSGVIIPSLCDTLRPLTQNFRVAVPEIPMIFLAHPQNRRPVYGIEYTKSQYGNIKKQLEEISGNTIRDDQLHEAIIIHNQSRAARREFTVLAGKHPAKITPAQRNAVLKSAYFMDKKEYTDLLRQLNAELSQLPEEKWEGLRIITSGILADSTNLLQLFADNQMAIVADDVAQESRSFRLDVPTGDDCAGQAWLNADPRIDPKDPLTALALHFAGQDFDPLLYDPELTKRPAYVVNLAKESGAHGAVILMMQFCDPEEIEYPSLKKALTEADIPSIVIGVDQQMTDFGQARTQIQAFAELLRFKRGE